jgi:hypothetical protein
MSGSVGVAARRGSSFAASAAAPCAGRPLPCRASSPWRSVLSRIRIFPHRRCRSTSRVSTPRWACRTIWSISSLRGPGQGDGNSAHPRGLERLTDPVAAKRCRLARHLETFARKPPILARNAPALAREASCLARNPQTFARKLRILAMARVGALRARVRALAAEAFELRATV